MKQWLVFCDDELLFLKQGEHYVLPDSSLSLPLIRQYSLGQAYCAEISKETALSSNMVLIPFRKSLDYLGAENFNIAAKAIQILRWDKNHHYCGRCAHQTELNPKIFERRCPQCSLVFYPRISPSIIVLIKKDDHILMARSPHFPPGVFGLIAGFIEPGESAEDAIHREVKEEVNIKIKNIQYFGSQSWPFPDSLMLAFTADYDSGEIMIDNVEIEEAGWYPIDNLPGYPSTSLSIARKLLDSCLRLSN